MEESYPQFLAMLGALVLFVAWAPTVLRKLPLSLPIICVAFGYAFFALTGTASEVDPLTHLTTVEHLTELVVIVSLAGAGLSLNRAVGWRRWSATWRLLAITMPLSILGIAAIGWGVLGLPIAVAALLGAVLAPTDPVLASDVQVGPPHDAEEDEVRFALTSEAGLNDGLSFPFTHLAVAMAIEGASPDRWLTDWLTVDVLWRIGAGLVVGFAAGQGLGRLVFRVVPRTQLKSASDSMVFLGITFLVYGGTELIHGYGFLAVFVATLGMRRQERTDEQRVELHEFGEQIERVLMMLLLVLFGGVLALGLLSFLTWPAALAGLACVLIVRPLAGLVGFLGAGRPWLEVATISYIGIRGLGSFYYLSYAYGEADFGHEGAVFSFVGFVVLVSIVLHGVTSTPLMRYLERRMARRASYETNA